MRLPCAILGSGNIGTDLMYKLLRSETLEPRAMVGMDPDSDGCGAPRAPALRPPPTACSGSSPPRALPLRLRGHVGGRAPRQRAAAGRGGAAVDRPHAGQAGPGVVPPVNLDEHRRAPDLNMISCGGQATIPIVAAVSAVTGPLRGDRGASPAARRGRGRGRASTSSPTPRRQAWRRSAARSTARRSSS